MIDLAREMNQVHPVAVSVVDTFGAMYQEDLERIVQVLDCELDAGIKLGFHSHNNQQLSFALTMHFVELFKDSKEAVSWIPVCAAWDEVQETQRQSWSQITLTVSSMGIMT